MSITDKNQYTLRPLHSRQVGGSGRGAAIVSMTMTEANGNNIAISPDVIHIIGAEQAVHIAAYEDGIAIWASLPGDDHSFNLRKNGKKFVLYCRAMVLELVEMFALFELFDGKTTTSFYEVTYRDDGDGQVAYVPLKQPRQAANPALDDCALSEHQG